MAAAVSLQLFLSLFPLLLIFVAVLGFITSSNAEITERFLQQLGFPASSIEVVQEGLTGAANSARTSTVLGVLGLIWSALAIPAVISYALDVTWKLPVRGITARLFGVVWGLVSLILLIGTFLTARVLRWLDVGPDSTVIAYLVLPVFNALFWLWLFRGLSGTRRPLRTYFPGVLLGTLGLELVKLLLDLAPWIVARTTAIYGTLGVALGIVLVFVMLGRLLVYASALNAVLFEQRVTSR